MGLNDRLGILEDEDYEAWVEGWYARDDLARKAARENPPQDSDPGDESDGTDGLVDAA